MIAIASFILHNCRAVVVAAAIAPTRTPTSIPPSLPPHPHHPALTPTPTTNQASPPLPTEAYTMLVPKFDKHALFAALGRKKHQFSTKVNDFKAQ